MRSFSKNDLQILERLSGLDTALPGQVDEFLNSFFFKQELGRALIIQAQNRYAVFFLATELFDNEVRKNEELTGFTDLLSLLKYLLNNGYISIHKNEKGKEKSMYFLQDSFVNAQPSAGAIVLNATGDYTSNPETIHSKDKQIAYKGVTFDHEMFDLILSTMTGSLIISQSLKDIVRGGANARLSYDKTLTAALLLTVLAVLIWSSVSTHSKDKVQNQQMALLMASHETVQAKLDRVIQKMQRADSIYTSRQYKTMTNPPSDTILYGIDVSKWNGEIERDLDVVDSISFVICKATQGRTNVDPSFRVNWNLLEKRAITKGAYHFYVFNEDPIHQAGFFWSVVQQLDSTDITPIVDIEEGSLSSHSKADPVKVQVALLLFLRHLQEISGRLPMIYTNVAFANEYLTNDTFADYPLWLADYTTRTEPSIPQAWRRKGFKIWQKSDDYAIESRNTDFDVFYGEKKELYN